jgi:hypothetical protein
VSTSTGTSASTETITPTVRTAVRRSLFWVVAGAIAILVALIGMIASSTNTARDFLDPTNAAPEGAKALVEVLRSEGVDVTTTASLAATRRAIDSPASTTLVVFDRDYLLTVEQRKSAFGLADRVVIIDPGFDDLMVAAPDIANAGVVENSLTADCALDAVVAAERVTGTGNGFRIITPQPETQSCLESTDGVYSLVRITDGAHTTTLVGTTAALSNEYISFQGNAALALTLLGASPHLVWYVPSLADLAGETPATLGELSPSWVMSVTALLALTALAAAIWRGRRFGPLVIENLPVVVRSSETTQGRARLYEKNAARGHSLDALRMGTLSRLAGVCGLSRTATVEEIIATVAALTGHDPSTVRDTLIAAVPRNDRDLVTLSDQLLALEENLRASVNSAGMPPKEENN